MHRLEGVSIDELEDHMTNLDENREAQRLMAAIIYKRGPSVPMIAEWLDKREATIYRWFDRLETESIDEAVRDEPRPGRPSKLGETGRSQLLSALEHSPKAAGYEAPSWTPKLIRQYLLDEFEVDYSLRHTRRLLKEASTPA